jgi:16S rRNA processing protein RimM
MPPGAADRPVTLAAIAGAHGISGEVRLKLFTDSPDNLRAHARFEAGGHTLTLKALRPGPQGAIARFAEISDRTRAEALRGTLLSVPRASLPPLPPGEYYWHDLVGLPVEDEAGALLGSVAAVENYGASDLIDVELAGGRRVLIPVVPAAVLEIGDRIRVARAFVEAA